MNFKLLLKNEHLLSILHKVLTNETTKNKVSNASINGESYSYNRYSLLITIDIVIKYKIIINDDIYNNYFLNRLGTITSNYNNHEDLIIKGNSLLIDLVSNKLNVTTIKTEDKKEILKYIYNKYIVNGYCFHSFPSYYKDEVDEEGLVLKKDVKEINDLKRINYIFEHHNYKNIISKDLNSKNQTLYITDSPAMAYFYAFRSPEYMAELTSLSKYYKYLKEYSKFAFYLKDYNKCRSNLESLCKHVNMTTKEETTVLKTFDRRWKALNLSDSLPCIAFIKRSELAKDSLPNIDEIIDSVDKIDLNILVSKILDSRYPVIRKYSNINSLDLKIVTMPSYREIKNNKFLFNEKQVVEDNTNLQDDYQEEKQYDFKYVYSYGNASVFALTGLLLITLGMTLTIIINVLGG